MNATPSAIPRQPALIAIDWGTSNLRASLLDQTGAVIETRSAAGGVMAVPDRQFAAALHALCDEWLNTTSCPLIASGMIGSRQGWKEAPYLDCPASVAEAASRLTTIEVAPGRLLHIVPGLTCVGRDGEHDVMRGEETQMWGAELGGNSCCVLPGTHSKWAWLGEHAEVTGFQTFMTGELYGLLTRHGILGRLMTFGHDARSAFEKGVRLGMDQHASATHVIFAARTAGLMSRLPANELADYLSGILIGVEIGSATLSRKPQAVTLLGDDDLCTRYETALRLAGIESSRARAGATTRGQWLVACQAALVEHMR